jgi:hypothetical protein
MANKPDDEWNEARTAACKPYAYMYTATIDWLNVTITKAYRCAVLRRVTTSGLVQHRKQWT